MCDGRTFVDAASQCPVHAYSAALQDGRPHLAGCLGRRTGAPRAQRLCQRCNQHAVGDERHIVFGCPALQSVRDKYATLFVHATYTMQQFMWQVDLPGVAHFIKDCFDLLDAPG